MSKKKPGKHLQFYMDCMKNDCKMPNNGSSVIKGGLCRAVDIGHISSKIFELFSEGKNDFHYWADENYLAERDIFSNSDYESRFQFNSLRQTIVLFMACLNGEL